MQSADLMSMLQGFGFRVILFQIPFYVSFWSLALAALLFIDARKYIEQQMVAFPRSSYTVAAIGAAITVIASTAAHEAAHSLAGWYAGITTTNGGLSWWGAYVQFDRALTTISPKYEILIAAAGPLTNLALALMMTGVVVLFGESNFENAVQYTAVLNYRLAMLNLLPVFVLDGNKVLDGLLRQLGVGHTGSSYISVIAAGLSVLWYFMKFTKKKSAFETYLERA
ncbi:MAG: peptidase [Parcubacteria group bacterium]|nr:peptidase [Parcubacteria group bacterium]